MDVIIEILNESNSTYILGIIHTRLPLDYYIPLIDHTFYQVWIFIGDRTYRNSELHSFDDQPALIYSDGDKYWYQHGKLLSRVIKAS